MDWSKEWRKLAVISAVFLGVFYLPVGIGRFNNAVLESLYLARWYAREHVILCLIPAFFIAGAIGVFVSKASVMKYFTVLLRFRELFSQYAHVLFCRFLREYTEWVPELARQPLFYTRGLLLMFWRLY